MKKLGLAILAGMGLMIGTITALVINHRNNYEEVIVKGYDFERDIEIDIIEYRKVK